MRIPLILIVVTLVFAAGCAAGFTVPAALAAGSSTTSAKSAANTGSASTSAASTSAASTSAASTSAASGSTSSAATSGPGFGLSSAVQNSSAANTTTTPVTTVTSSTSTSTSGGLSGTDAVLIAVVALMVLVGIAAWIRHDARTHAARVGHGSSATDPMFGGRSHAGSKAPRKARKPKAAERRRRKRGRAR